jgi:hypothetical protein
MLEGLQLFLLFSAVANVLLSTILFRGAGRPSSTGTVGPSSCQSSSNASCRTTALSGFGAWATPD